ncbi:hypothetical protein K461DRAFT_254967 [Myriangium duriaei CBS 260.36]|uniref:pH-response regulator protein palC n=1 Tax=Myriangium duriaei CBS 260.36 TaxID=1168546 RepID=A0A9P4J1I0_9PEZI|nr:hypothetical protein K461DRAFT_254967 [Myriangium duriaei CBS 260.36]
MPFPYTLPTTSATSLAPFFTSTTHPSLIFSATSQRALVRDILKRHKRLAPPQQAANITSVQNALNSYIPYLLSIYNSSPDAFGATNYGGHAQISVSETKDLLTEWRSTVSSSIPGREPSRVKVRGLRNELAFVLQTLAYTYTHLARSVLFELQRMTSPTSEVRASSIATAMKHLLEAHSIHTYVASLHETSDAPTPVDVSPSTSSALASLAMAEATLIVVLKDDPYAAAVAEDRNKDSKEWMIAAPTIPKVRAHLFARLCTAAADHAAKASSLLLGTGKVDDDLARYCQDLRRTARGKAARFLGIDTEASGKTGEGIAWLRGAKRELGIVSDDDSDRRLEKGADDWGLDAGRLEEIRVVEWLEAKWVKSNDTINVQTVPPFEPLLATMPSGREYHKPKQYQPPLLDASTLNRLRAPIDPSERAFTGDEDDSGDESTLVGEPVGAFPGTGGHYSRSDSTYY